MRKRFIRTAILLSLLTVGIGGLWGCDKTPAPAAHTAEEITAVAVSHSGMDRSYNHSFYLRTEADEWLFDAACFTCQHEVETELVDCPVTAEEIDECMSVLTENDIIAYVENHSSAKKNNHASDAESSSIALTFSDGTQCIAEASRVALETFFYDLAERYADAGT